MRKVISVILAFFTLALVFSGCKKQSNQLHFSQTEVTFGEIKWDMTKEEVRTALGVSKKEWGDETKNYFEVKDIPFYGESVDMVILFAEEGNLYSPPETLSILRVNLDEKTSKLVREDIANHYGEGVDSSPSDKISMISWQVPFTVFGACNSDEEQYSAFFKFFLAETNARYATDDKPHYEEIRNIVDEHLRFTGVSEIQYTTIKGQEMLVIHGKYQPILTLFQKNKQ